MKLQIQTPRSFTPWCSNSNLTCNNKHQHWQHLQQQPNCNSKQQEAARWAVQTPRRGKHRCRGRLYMPWCSNNNLTCNNKQQQYDYCGATTNKQQQRPAKGGCTNTTKAQIQAPRSFTPWCNSISLTCKIGNNRVISVAQQQNWQQHKESRRQEAGRGTL